MNDDPVDTVHYDTDSGTGYESTLESYVGLRRKMESSDEENKNGTKKPKKEKLLNRLQEKKRNKTKNKANLRNMTGNTENNNTEKENNWQTNKTYKTFFMEPNEENSKHIHIMEMARILHALKITEYSELKPAGRARYKITFNNPRHAEKLINCHILKESYNYKIYVPNMLKETIGVLRNIPPTIPNDEILNNLKDQSLPILKVERIMKLNRNSDNTENPLIATYSVKIYLEGQTLPKEVKIYGIPTRVEVYVFPLRYCKKCCRYGYIRC